MRRDYFCLLGGCAASLAAAPALAQTPDPRDARIAELQGEVDSLSARMAGLEARLAAMGPAQIAPAPAPAPALSAPAAPTPGGLATVTAGKPVIASADARFSANFHAVMQFDAAHYDQASAGPIATDLRRGAAAADTARARDLSSGSNFRRGRFGVDGKMFGDFDYSLLFEFGGAGEEDAGHLQELWVQYSGSPPLRIKVGAFSPPIGLEDQGSTNGMLFLERPAVADMARSVAGGDFREGATIWGAGTRWYAAASATGRVVGVVNSQATGVAQPYDAPLNLIGRAVFLPVREDNDIALLGVHSSYVARPADTGGPDTAIGAARYGLTVQERPELRVDGTRLVSTGAIDIRHAQTTGIEAAYQHRNLFLQGEYERFGLERRNPGTGSADFAGWYAEGSWVVTGEARRFNAATFAFDAPSVDHPFSLANGALGALELAARYSTIDLDYRAGVAGAAMPAGGVRGGEQTIWSGGINWYPNSAIRLMADYQSVRIERLAPTAGFGGGGVLAGSQIGQRYHVVSFRTQFSF